MVWFMELLEVEPSKPLALAVVLADIHESERKSSGKPCVRQ